MLNFLNDFLTVLFHYISVKVSTKVMIKHKNSSGGSFRIKKEANTRVHPTCLGVRFPDLKL